MPKLLAFAACEKIILEEGSGNLSLVSIFHELNLEALEEDMPPGVAFPLRWYMMSYWVRESGDSLDAEFEETYTLQRPNGESLEIGRRSFHFATETMRNISTFVGFPAEAGTYRVRLNIRKQPNGEFAEVVSYPIAVRFKTI